MTHTLGAAGWRNFPFEEREGTLDDETYPILAQHFSLEGQNVISEGLTSPWG
jgi:hypothetical protein